MDLGMMEAPALNAVCPWSGEAVSPDSLTRYRGHTVGFCNAGCRDKFDTATALFDASIGRAGRVAGLTLFERAARYNQWFNKRLFNAVARLDPEQYRRDAGAFFGSVETSLNHIMVWDIMWLQRLAQSLSEPASLLSIQAWTTPKANDQIIHDDLAKLARARSHIDSAILALIQGLTADQLEQRVHYQRQNGAEYDHSVAEVMQHLFNHQTHHRGQITTLLSQAGIDPGVTDMIAMVIDEAVEEKCCD